MRPRVDAAQPFCSDWMPEPPPKHFPRCRLSRTIETIVSRNGQPLCTGTAYQVCPLTKGGSSALRGWGIRYSTVCRSETFGELRSEFLSSTLVWKPFAANL